MISKKLFDQVQEVMANKSRPRKQKIVKQYAFRGLFKCGECGCAITSETQKGHIYYRCSKKRTPCSQKYMREENLDTQISKILQKFSLNSTWANKMIEELDKEKEGKAQAEFSFAQDIKSQIKICDNKLDKLLEAYLSDLISQEEYALKKGKILNQKIENQEKLKSFEQKDNHWLERAKNFISQANQVQTIAGKGTLQEKHLFLKKVGSNLVLKNSKIKFFPRQAWKIIGNLPDFVDDPAKFEGGNLAGETNFFKFSIWRERPDSNRQPFP
ncbi:zinc ribbon domain-containing protein [Patescibacteria group bacterium]|nr:zinc ribbon domain-containing protein [Patescibacteria group bacterium]